MTGQKPLVSIVIPVYNGANYLREAIESALGQTYENCEVLVINDGSSDQGETEREALKFGDRIRYFKKENGGVASALNFGIRKMQGEYFSWLSHDDVYSPQKIEKQLAAVLQSGNPAALVQAEYEFYNEDTGSRTPTRFLKHYRPEQITNSCFSVLQLQSHACSALIHKSHFERAGLFDESLKTIQDIDMWFRIFRGQKSLFLADILHMVREHREAGSNTISCYHEETRKEYAKLVRQMPNEEIQQVFGNAGAFLCRMAGFVKSYGGGDELREIEDRLRNMEADSEEVRGLKGFYRTLSDFSRNKAKRIVIFGSGQYGIRVKYDLESRLVMPEYFMDNNPRKQGTVIDGIPCKSKEELLAQKGDTLVVIAMRNCEEAVKELEAEGIPYYVTRQELDPILLNTPPAVSRKEEWLGK